jgi:putative MATE family efflux protein
MTLNMTEGKPFPLILRYYIPLVLTSAFQMLYNFADSVIVGRFVGTNTMAAVGSTASITFFFIGFLNGVGNGFNIPIARMFGAGDQTNLRRYFANMTVLGIIIGLVMTSITLLMLNKILLWMDTPAVLFEDCHTYLSLMFGGILTIMMYNLYAGTLRSVGDSRTPFLCLIIACFLNIGLNLFFTISLKMKVFGVGIATVISQGFSALFCLLVLYRKCGFMMPQKEDWMFRRDICLDLLKNGIPMGMQLSITAIGSLALQGAVNRLGTEAVAAVSAATRVRQIAYFTLGSLGTAGATYCSQNLGARRIDRINEGVRVMFLFSIVLCLLNSLIIIFFGEPMINLFFKEPSPKLTQMGMQLLYTGMYLYIFLACIYLFRSCIQGLGYAAITLLCGLMELIARFIASYFLAEKFQYTGICFADTLAWIMADAIAIPVFFVLLRKIHRQYDNRKRTNSI